MRKDVIDVKVEIIFVRRWSETRKTMETDTSSGK